MFLFNFIPGTNSSVFAHAVLAVSSVDIELLFNKNTISQDL